MKNKTPKKLLNDGNAKTIKGEKLGFKTFGLHLSPSDKSGFNTCQWASKGCRMACLDTAGRGIMSNVQASRIAKTRYLFEYRADFVNQLRSEIGKAIKRAEKLEMVPCFRLNLTSDIPWETYGIIEEFPQVTFYDYTKGTKRMSAYLAGELPPNYHLTYSRSERKGDDLTCLAFLESGGNVAIVFRNELPKTWKGYEVINGDESDLRFRDGSGKVVGLVEKGMAKKDETGFVVEGKGCYISAFRAEMDASGDEEMARDVAFEELYNR